MKNLSKKKTVLLVVGVLVVLTLLIGVSYAYWVLTFTQTEQNIVNSGCFKIEFTEKNPISLANAFPMYDRGGMKETPYTFTINNVCDSSATFQINLESLVPNGKVLPDYYIKTNLSEGTSSKITTKLVDEIQTEVTISGAVKAYKLYTGILDPNETKEFNLRLWMDEDVEAVEDAMNASYSGKVSIIASYYEDNRGIIISSRYSETRAFWGYKDKITKVVMEDTMSPKETDLTWDVSAEKNGSVMSYLVRNESEEELYTLYLQSDGGIKANPDSGYLFKGFNKLKSIEGLEYFDTSKVTNMAMMFYDCNSLTNLDLSSFDTSNVTNMFSMFEYCSSLTSLDIIHLNTSNVTNMLQMFNSCSSLTSLDLSHFDTSNVTNMSSMFSGCSSLTSIDLSSFDISKVTNMSGMFNGCSNLTSLDVSHFDTSNVSNMYYLFRDCSSLTSLDLSNFDTSKVTNTKEMFSGCSSLTNLNLSHFDTSNVTDMNDMFYNCSSLISLDVSSFDTSKVTGMSGMFSRCSSLTTLDLSGWNTSKVTVMRSMFNNCSSLMSLDLSSFDISSIENKSMDMEYIFRSMPTNAIVKVKDESMQNWILTSSNTHPNSWTTENVVITV